MKRALFEAGYIFSGDPEYAVTPELKAVSRSCPSNFSNIPIGGVQLLALDMIEQDGGTTFVDRFMKPDSMIVRTFNKKWPNCSAARLANGFPKIVMNNGEWKFEAPCTPCEAEEKARNSQNSTSTYSSNENFNKEEIQNAVVDLSQKEAGENKITIEPSDAIQLVGTNPFVIARLPNMWFGNSLKEATGKDFEIFVNGLNVASNIEQKGNYVLGVGCVPHSCGIDMSAFAIDIRNGNLIFILLQNGKLAWVKGTESGSIPSDLCEVEKNEEIFNIVCG